MATAVKQMGFFIIFEKNQTMKNLLVAIGFLLFLNVQAQHLEPVWQTRAVFKVPESVWYDAARGLLYVSNINGYPSNKNQKKEKVK